MPTLATRFTRTGAKQEVSRARYRIIEGVWVWGNGEAADVTRLGAPELIANTVIHGAGSVTVGLHHCLGRLVIAVSDRNQLDLVSSRAEVGDAENGAKSPWPNTSWPTLARKFSNTAIRRERRARFRIRPRSPRRRRPWPRADVRVNHVPITSRVRRHMRWRVHSSTAKRPHGSPPEISYAAVRLPCVRGALHGR